jgi:NADH-quinone oxidoreductase subunit L
VTAPLVLLAIPSVVIGFMTIGPMLYGEFFKDSIAVLAERHPALEEMAKEFHGAFAMGVHGLLSVPFFLALAGVVLAYVFYLVKPSVPAALKERFALVYRILENKYYMDWFNEHVIAPFARLVGRGLWKGGDAGLIDGVLIDGSARAVGNFASVVRLVQTGYLYWYALVMILGVLGLMTWQLWPSLQAALKAAL